MTELLIETERRAWFTADSLASYLQVSDRMIRKWVAEGRLRSYKLDGCRRFDPGDIDDFVSQFRDERETIR
jgi:excisionase family DNA binding protein